MQLDELCRILFNEALRLTPELSGDLAVSKKNVAVTLHVKRDDLKLHLSVNRSKLSIDGSVRTPRFTARIDIGKRCRIYQKDGPVPEFWRAIDTAIRQ